MSGGRTLGSARILRAGEGILPSELPDGRAPVHRMNTRSSSSPQNAATSTLQACAPQLYERIAARRTTRGSVATGAVAGRGVDVAGGPIPRKPGYYGEPVVKPPVWTWEIPIYFFFGGIGGMSAVIAFGAFLFHHVDLARTAMWVAAIAVRSFRQFY